MGGWCQGCTGQLERWAPTCQEIIPIESLHPSNTSGLGHGSPGTRHSRNHQHVLGTCDQPFRHQTNSKERSCFHEMRCQNHPGTVWPNGNAILLGNSILWIHMQQLLETKGTIAQLNESSVSENHAGCQMFLVKIPLSSFSAQTQP